MFFHHYINNDIVIKYNVLLLVNNFSARVSWQDRKSSSEVAEMCGLEDLSVKLRQRGLRWFVKRTRGGCVG